MIWIQYSAEQISNSHKVLLKLIMDITLFQFKGGLFFILNVLKTNQSITKQYIF